MKCTLFDFGDAGFRIAGFLVVAGLMARVGLAVASIGSDSALAPFESVLAVLAVGFLPASVFLMVVLLGMIFGLGDCAWVRRRSVEELTKL